MLPDTKLIRAKWELVVYSQYTILVLSQNQVIRIHTDNFFRNHPVKTQPTCLVFSISGLRNIGFVFLWIRFWKDWSWRTTCASHNSYSNALVTIFFCYSGSTPWAKVNCHLLCHTTMLPYDDPLFRNKFFLLSIEAFCNFPCPWKCGNEADAARPRAVIVVVKPK